MFPMLQNYPKTKYFQQNLTKFGLIFVYLARLSSLWALTDI